MAGLKAADDRDGGRSCPSPATKLSPELSPHLKWLGRGVGPKVFVGLNSWGIPPITCVFIGRLPSRSPLLCSIYLKKRGTVCRIIVTVIHIKFMIDPRYQLETTNFPVHVSKLGCQYSAPSENDYKENKAHSLGVRKTVRVLSGKLSKLNLPLSTRTVSLTPNECALFSV